MFFVWYMVNVADISKSYVTQALARLGTKVAYAVQCAFCLAFWLTLVLYILTPIPWTYLFCAPVINLFLVKLHSFLSMEVHSSS